jgi:hypothetical protein
MTFFGHVPDPLNQKSGDSGSHGTDTLGAPNCCTAVPTKALSSFLSQHSRQARCWQANGSIPVGHKEADKRTCGAELGDLLPRLQTYGSRWCCPLDRGVGLRNTVSAHWICRPGAALEICPQVTSPNVVSGSPKFALLKALNISARN